MNKFLDKIIVESNKVQVKIEQKENKLRKIYSKVLITSFKGKNNSSSILLNNIRANLTDKLELTNSFITSEKELKQKIDKSKYKYIISFGQKPNSNKLYIELFGNKNDDTPNAITAEPTIVPRNSIIIFFIFSLLIKSLHITIICNIKAFYTI